MLTASAWQYDEFQSVGRDYSSPLEVDRYDASHADFRDMVADSDRILDRLQLQATDTLIDFGAGTGIFARQAAQRCQRVYAVDVSLAMLNLAQAQAAQAQLHNIEFHHAGFLSYEHRDAPVDAIATTFALHHLPDFWKGIALQRLHHMLKPGGQLYLHDVVLPSPNAPAQIEAFIQQQAAAGGDFLREDAEGHFREEFSTYDWVMVGLLERAGFAIATLEVTRGVLATYWCTKIPAPPTP